MPFDVVVFDFDGTLVASAEAKREAFFALFPDSPAHRAAVAEVLATDPEGSRYDVIPRLVAAMRSAGLPLPPGHDAEERIAAYSAAVSRAVAACPEAPGASALLRALRGRSAVYVCSNTPEDALAAELARRGWDRLVEGAFGFPKEKSAAVAALLRRHRASGASVAVIGDGASDEGAARANGCVFFRVRSPRDLPAIGRELGAEVV